MLRHFTTWPWEDKVTPSLRTDGVLYGLGYKEKEKKNKVSKTPEYGHVWQELGLLVTVSIISQWGFRVNTGTRARESEMRETRAEPLAEENESLGHRPKALPLYHGGKP